MDVEDREKLLVKLKNQNIGLRSKEWNIIGSEHKGKTLLKKGAQVVIIDPYFQFRVNYDVFNIEVHKLI